MANSMRGQQAMARALRGGGYRAYESAEFGATHLLADGFGQFVEYEQRE